MDGAAEAEAGASHGTMEEPFQGGMCLGMERWEEGDTGSGAEWRPSMLASSFATDSER